MNYFSMTAAQMLTRGGASRHGKHRNNERLQHVGYSDVYSSGSADSKVEMGKIH